MHFEAKSKINHLLPRVMVSVVLLCVGLSLVSCSSLGTHEERMDDRDDERSSVRPPEQSIGTLPRELSNPNSEEQKQASEAKEMSKDISASLSKKTAPKSHGETANNETIDSDAADKAMSAEDSASEVKKSEQVQSEALLSEGAASVDDYSLPIDQPMLHPAKGGSSSNDKQAPQEQLSSKDAKGSMNSFSSETETAVSPNVNDSSNGAPMNASDLAKGLDAKRDALESVALTVAQDEKGLSDIANKAIPAKEKQGQGAIAPTTLGDQDASSSDVRSKEQSDILLRKDRGAKMIASDDAGPKPSQALVLVEEIDVKNSAQTLDLVRSGDVTIKGDFERNGNSQRTLIYDGGGADVMRQSNRNIRWNLQRPPSADPAPAE